MNFKLFAESLKKTDIPHETLKRELLEQLKKCRAYTRNARNGAYDYLNSYPCGYQDAHVDKVRAMFEVLEILKLAHAFQSGNVKRCRVAFNRMIEKI